MVEWPFDITSVRGSNNEKQEPRGGKKDAVNSSRLRHKNTGPQYIEFVEFFGQPQQGKSRKRCRRGYTLIPARPKGSSLIRVPVAANMAFVIAGVAAAIGGSPRPVGELSL